MINPMKMLVTRTMVQQHKGGRMFLFEHAPGSEVWNEPEFAIVWAMPGVMSTPPTTIANGVPCISKPGCRQEEL